MIGGLADPEEGVTSSNSAYCQSSFAALTGTYIISFLRLA